MKNVVIVDVDIDFSAIVKKMRASEGGYVSLEYYYEVDDAAFAELGGMDVLFSQAAERGVLDVLGGARPFDGISSGRASLARTELDAPGSGKDGHSRKVRDVLAAAQAERVLRICHTRNLFRNDSGQCVRMYCRSFELDPATLGQTPAAPPPRSPETGPGAVKDLQQLFDFLAIRKGIHQKVDVETTYKVKVLDPSRDYDDKSAAVVAQGLGFDEAMKTAVAWLRGKFGSGELALDRTVLRIDAPKKIAVGGKPFADGIVSFQNIRAGGPDQAEISLCGKKLTVRKSQPLVLFQVQPVTTRTVQYDLSESAYIDYVAHMLDGCRW